jgi:hypothetical protein
MHMLKRPPRFLGVHDTQKLYTSIPYRFCFRHIGRPIIIYESKNLFGKAEDQIFRHFRRDMFYVVKHTITTHYRAKMFLHLLGVHLQTNSEIFGGPNNYLFFA